MSAVHNRCASIVVPVLNAERMLRAQLEAILAQKPDAPREIILIDSLSTDATRQIGQSYPDVRIIPIARFSHGRARNIGAREAEGEIVIMLTQDALPSDQNWLAKLLEPFADPQVAAVYSRQIPRDDAPPTEKFFLQYHFPEGTPLKKVRPPNRPPAFPDVFFSNVSGAARRELLLRHPFDETLIMSEDQQFARDLLNAGFAVVYQPQSAVIHSHHYSLGTAFRRYFDSIYSLTVIFPAQDIKTSAAMGRRYLRREIRFILRKHPFYLPYYLLYNLAKTAGALAGHFGAKLPRRMARLMSLHRYYWEDEPN